MLNPKELDDLEMEHTSTSTVEVYSYELKNKEGKTVFTYEETCSMGGDPLTSVLLDVNHSEVEMSNEVRQELQARVEIQSEDYDSLDDFEEEY